MIPILVGAAFVFVIVVVCAFATKWHREAIEENFPPISDAEFVARCRPGTDPEVALKVRRIVAEHFGIPYERVHPSMSFIEDLG